MNLRELYCSAFSTAFIGVGDDGVMYNALSGSDDKTIMTLQGKPLRMSGPNANYGPDYITVHPLLETISTSVSPVIERMMLAHAQGLHLKIQQLFSAILIFGASPAEHSKAKGDMGDILRACADASTTEVNAFKQLMGLSNSPTTQDYRFIRLKIKPQLRKGGVTYPFGCVVTFPLYEKLKTHAGKIGTVAITKKAVRVFKKIYEYIFPDIDKDESYTYQACVNTGPRYSGVLEAVHDICFRLNDISDEMDGVERDTDLIVSDLSWYDAFRNFDTQFIGEARVWTKESTVTAGVRAPAAQPGLSSTDASRVVDTLNQNARQAASSIFNSPTVNQSVVANQPPQLPATPPASVTPTKATRSFEEVMASSGGQPHQAQAGASVMVDGNGQTWIIQNGVPVPCAPMGQAPMQQPAPPPMIRPVAQQMQPTMMPPGVVGIYTDPQTGMQYYYNASNQIVGTVPMGGMQGMPGNVPVQGMQGYPSQIPVQRQGMTSLFGAPSRAPMMGGAQYQAMNTPMMAPAMSMNQGFGMGQQGVQALGGYSGGSTPNIHRGF